MSTTNGIGKKVLGELGDVVKKTVEETKNAGVDIVKGTVETVVGGVDPVTQPGKRQVETQAVEHGDPAEMVKRESAAKKQKGLQRVRGEIAEYIREKKQGEMRQEQVEERQIEIKKQQKEQVKENQREAMIRQAQVSGGGTREMPGKKH